MPTTKLILQQPYRVTPKSDKTKTPPSGEGARNSKKKKPLNPNKTRLYCFFILDRDHIVKIKTEYVILPEEWDFRTQQKKEIKGNEVGTPEANEKIKRFNKELQQLKEDIEEVYKNTIKAHPDMPFSQVSTILKDYGKKKEVPFAENDKDFFGYLDDYMLALEGSVSPRTVAKFKSVKLSLQAFVKENKKYSLLTFSMIDHSFKDAYVKFLHKQPARGRMKTRPEGLQTGVLINTEAKYIECIKGFCKWAQERKFNKYSTYIEFKPITSANKKRQKKKHDIVTLTLAELKQFYAHDFSDSPTLDHVRDLWCFGAFTLQRWSDIERFDKSQLEGEVWSFESYKTKKKTDIYLVGYSAPALDILKKYDFKLPVISLAKFNLYLKDAAKAAGITKETAIMRYVGPDEIPISNPKYKFLGSHSARRTGVSILLNDFNMNPIHVMSLTGHTDLETLSAYIKEDPDARRKAVGNTKRIDDLMTIVKQEAV